MNATLEHNALLTRSVIKYEANFKYDKLETVKLTQHMNDGTTYKRDAYIYNGQYGIESLLYCYHRFQMVCNQLDWTEGIELFEGWSQIMRGSAEERWNQQTMGIPYEHQDANRFCQEYERFKLTYCYNTAKDTFNQYLMSAEVKKKHDADCREHGERLILMCRYHNELPGTVADLTEADIKRIIYNSYPTNWTLNYDSSGNNYERATVQDIMAFMSTQKARSDALEATGNKRKNREGPQYETNQGRNCGRGNGRFYAYNNRNLNQYGNYNNYTSSNSYFQSTGRGNYFYRGGSPRNQFGN